jgi:hypothetical protein
MKFGLILTKEVVMSFQRYFSALFIAGALSAGPMIGMADDDSDNRNQPSFNSQEEHTPETMTQQPGLEMESPESLAQLPSEGTEPLSTGYCFTESAIDGSTGEIIAYNQVCEEEMADVA